MTTLTIKNITIVQMPLSDHVYLNTNLPDYQLSMSLPANRTAAYCSQHFSGVPILIKQGY